MNKLRIMHVLALIFFTCGVSYSQSIDYDKLGIERTSGKFMKPLKVGSTAPDFKFSLGGDSVSLSEFVREHPVVLLFYRGHWCPVCNRFLSKFQEDLYMFEERGIQVLAVTPQKEEYIEQTIDKIKLSIPVVSDINGKIMKQYGVAFGVTDEYERMIRENYDVNIAETNGDEEAQLPVPATYFISEGMTIRFVHYDKNYKNRASVKDILNGIK